MTAFGIQPRISGSAFFPPAPAVCRITRAEIEAPPMKKRGKARKLKGLPKRRRKVRVAATGQEGRDLVCSPRIRAILVQAATMYGITLDELLGPGRFKLFFLARTYAAVRLKREVGLSYPQIGGLMQRDHATVINMIRPKKLGRRGR